MFGADFFMNIFGIVIAVLILSLLVAVHEAGHLLMAKWCNVRVDVFSIGMGKPLWGFQYGETFYQIGALPFGGYCGFGDEEKDSDPRSLMNSPLWARLLTIIGGSLFNILFAYFVMMMMYGAGFNELQISNQVAVPPMMSDPVSGEAVDSPAYKAGIRSGDYIISIDGQPVQHFQRIPMALSLSADREKSVVYVHGTQTNTAMIESVDNPATGINMLGVQPIVLPIVDSSSNTALRSGDIITAVNGHRVDYLYELVPYLHESVEADILRDGQYTNHVLLDNLEGIIFKSPEQKLIKVKADSAAELFTLPYEYIHTTISQIAVSIVKLFSGQVNAQDNLSGPVRIISITSEIAQTLDLTILVKFMVMLSIALGVFNLLPFPGLDGGHIVLQTARAVFKNNKTAERVISFIEQGGIMILLAIAVFVLFNDVRNIVSENLPETTQTND